MGGELNAIFNACSGLALFVVVAFIVVMVIVVIRKFCKPKT